MELRIESTRGGMVESVHRVSAAVADQRGRLLAGSGDPDLVTFWRSAAKPFQAIPLVADGAADRWGLTDRELALACASHSSEPVHLEVVEAMLRKVGCSESALACGPHPPLSTAVAEQITRTGLALSPKWSNCSGKHDGMLGLARHHGWPIAGYEKAGHPVQERVVEEITRWSGVRREDLRLGVDGCTTVCFGLPLRAMALAYARFGAFVEPAAVRLRSAMSAHPVLVAGTGRLCTDLMAAYPGDIIAKVGAGGVYGAALPAPGYGIALKVEDGDMQCSPVALLAILRQVAERFRLPLDLAQAPASVRRHAESPTENTRGTVTGSLRAAGKLRFSD